MMRAKLTSTIDKILNKNARRNRPKTTRDIKIIINIVSRNSPPETDPVLCAYSTYSLSKNKIYSQFCQKYS